MTETEHKDEAVELTEGMRDILLYYGPEHQLHKLMEECGELVQALAILSNDPTPEHLSNVLEEYCDVSNVGDQILMAFDDGQSNVDRRLGKIRRELGRIAEREKTMTAASNAEGNA